MTIYISKKKMNELKNDLPNLITNKDEAIKVYEYLLKFLNFDENKSTYNKDDYDKYMKGYYERNKERLNKKTVENRKKKTFKESNYYLKI